jgi:hypothetical protein
MPFSVDNKAAQWRVLGFPMYPRKTVGQNAQTPRAHSDLFLFSSKPRHCSKFTMQAEISDEQCIIPLSEFEPESFFPLLPPDDPPEKKV